MRMRLRKGYAPARRRPKRIAKKLKKRWGWSKYRVPPWIVMMQALNRGVAEMVAERDR